MHTRVTALTQDRGLARIVQTQNQDARLPVAKIAQQPESTDEGREVVIFLDVHRSGISGITDTTLPY